MIATYTAVLVVCAASLALGQAAIALCGARRWSWISPAVGLALLCALCWGTVRMPGEGVVSAVVVLVAVAASGAFLRGRAEGGVEALRVGLPVAGAALFAASVPFAVEGHFGILGTGFNPDMSQHLLATDRLVEGADSQLLRQGYPLGPHAVVAALEKGLGIDLVQGFSGLTVAVAVLAPLCALAAFTRGPATRRIAPALVVGLIYLVASYHAQGSFKETMQALFVLAFVLALRASTRDPEWGELSLRFLPAALIALGSFYTYSFPGLIWFGGALLAWLALERELPLRPLLIAGAVFLVAALPELGRAIDFQRFETFDPSGPGLGNLFGQISPFTALGIWPSGDFRLAPGDGAVPAVVYYLGAGFATALLLRGLLRCWRGRETAIVAGVAAAVAVYLASRAGGTAYTSAKALEVAAPLLALAILVPHFGAARVGWRLSPHIDGKGATSLAFGAYIFVAAGCSVLALANAPVGPTTYSPALTGLRPVVGSGPTLVLAPKQLLEEEHGERYIVWELRGGRVCVEPESAAGGVPPAGVRFAVTWADTGSAPFERLTLRRRAGPYLLWERTGAVRGQSDCPLIAVRQARRGP